MSPKSVGEYDDGGKKQELFRRQKRTLDLFLERNAISKAQYDKSLGDLIERMGIEDK